MTRRRLFVGLVLKGEPAIEVGGLRRGLGSPDLHRLAAHLTLVPPFNVAEGRFDEVVRAIKTTCSSYAPLVLNLGPLASFEGPGVVYLEVAGDLEELHRLRGDLVESLGRPGEERAFIPHVTVGTRLSPARIEAARLALSSFARRIEVHEVTLLERAPADLERRWSSSASFRLDQPFVHGRGGRELLLSSSTNDPLVGAFLRSSWADYRRDRYQSSLEDEPFMCDAKLNDVIVAAADGTFTTSTCRLSHLVVQPAHQSEGIGAALLSYVERLAAERGCSEVQLLAAADGRAASFYERHGYVERARLPNWRDGLTFSLYARELK